MYRFLFFMSRKALNRELFLLFERVKATYDIPCIQATAFPIHMIPCVEDIFIIQHHRQWRNDIGVMNVCQCLLYVLTIVLQEV